MRIAVCMKQVPATSDGDMDKETGVLIRTGAEAITNVYDLAALEAGLQVKAVCGGQVDVFTMGPDKAEAVIREAFSMGADRGFLICDRAFAGADVLATSYTLMQAIKSIDSYDLILCGRQTTDGDTAQVSGALAKWLGITHINWVASIDKPQGDCVNISYHMDERKVWAQAKLPVLLSVEKEEFVPRMPTLKLKISSRKKEISTLTLSDFEDHDSNHYGLYGSATRVFKIFPPDRTNQRSVIQTSGDKAADYMIDILKSAVLKRDGGDKYD